MPTLIYPVILAGGSGTRLWPRSREKNPKQFIYIINGRSLFQETCLRFKNRNLFAAPTIITHEDNRFLVRDQLFEIGITDANILTEPIAKNTLAACLLGAFFIEQHVGNVPIIFSPSDHIIEKEEILFSTLKDVLQHVLDGSLCIFGIKPDTAHTGYGYIVRGEKLFENIYKPSLFTEKPDKTKAEQLIKEEALWNSGIYFCTPGTLKKESSLYSNETFSILELFFKEKLYQQKGFFCIPSEIYGSIESVSIDKAITERTKKIVVAEISIAWSDLGSWLSLYNHFKKTNEGNVVRGDSVVLNTKNSYIESTNKLVAVVGLEDIGVVETPDAVLVFPLNQSEDIKKVVNTLTQQKRKEISVHTTVHRPWGFYTILGGDAAFQSKKITVLPGAELSLQRHKHRAEHWIVIEGIATVTRDNEVFELQKNESTFLPAGSVHRLQNKYNSPLSLIEVQTGNYFGEDDIERLSDTYGRI